MDKVSAPTALIMLMLQGKMEKMLEGKMAIPKPSLKLLLTSSRMVSLREEGQKYQTVLCKIDDRSSYIIYFHATTHLIFKWEAVHPNPHLCFRAILDPIMVDKPMDPSLFQFHPPSNVRRRKSRLYMWSDGKSGSKRTS